MELWDIYDAERQKTERDAKRGETLGSGDMHMVVHVCIFNSKGEMLIQQRQSHRDKFPNMWDVTVGGNALKGEKSAQAAERETLEEIGYTLTLAGQRPHFTVNFEHGFDDFYLVGRDIDVNTLKLQQKELKAVKWAAREEIHQMIKNEDFIPYYKSLVDMIFDMQGQIIGAFCENK